MQLLVLILKKTEKMPSIISELMDKGYGDPTVINAEGAVGVLDESNIEPPPIFGALRSFINGSESRESKVMLLVIADDKVAGAKELIPDKVGGIDKPNTGIIFTVPLSGVEGLAIR